MLEVRDPTSGYTVRVTADCVETLGSRLWDLTVTGPNPIAENELGNRGRQLAERVTALPEPLALVEVDAQGRVAQLRSRTPSQRHDTRSYTEALVHVSGATEVRRYQAPRPGESRRQQVPFTLTHEAIGQLVNELGA